MKKTLVGVDKGDYAFDKDAGTITLSGVTGFDLGRLGLIINVTRSVILFQSDIIGLGATVAGNVISLEIPTSGFLNTDDLQIILFEPETGATIENQDPLIKYKIQDREYSGFTTYYGRVMTNGTYLITKEVQSTTQTTYRYANISNNPSNENYQDAYANRADLVYDYLFNLTGI